MVKLDHQCYAHLICQAERGFNAQREYREIHRITFSGKLTPRMSKVRLIITNEPLVGVSIRHRGHIDNEDCLKQRLFHGTYKWCRRDSGYVRDPT